MIKFLLNHIPRPRLLAASEYLMPVMDIFYRGNKWEDPINGKKYRKFLPYGYQKIRPNALSPGTLSLERHRALWLFLQRHTDFFENTEAGILHLAPEQAFVKRFKKIFGRNYVTVDLHSPLAEIKADITDLPFDDDYFDVILCNHVLEHIPDDHKAMQELYRVMKPGGYGIFQVPLEAEREKTFEDPSISDPKKRAELFGQYDHVRVYGKDYFDRLREAGFIVEAIPVANIFTSDEIRRYVLDPAEIIPLVKKPVS